MRLESGININPDGNGFRHMKKGVVIKVEMGALLKSSGGKKAVIIVSAVILTAILLIIFGNKSEPSYTTAEEADYISEYSRELEEKIAALVDRLDGVSDVCAAVMLECGKEAVYAENISESGGNTAKQYVSYGNGLVQIKELVPKVSGVAVVCRAGNSAKAESEIINLLSALLGIPSNHIYVST